MARKKTLQQYVNLYKKNKSAKIKFKVPKSKFRLPKLGKIKH